MCVCVCKYMLCGDHLPKRNISRELLAPKLGEESVKQRNDLVFFLTQLRRLLVYIYIYSHAYAHIYMHVNDMYEYKYSYTYIYIYIIIYMHEYLYIYIYVYR